MKQLREHWSTAAAPLAFGLALTMVIASCGRAASPTSPSASSASLAANTEGDPTPTPTPEEPPPPPPEPTPTPTPPEGGGEGCTPGYWKVEQHWDSWPAPYTPNTLFSSVFENAFPGKTLVQVASTGGGGLDALGRHTVAALLNSASSGVDFDLSTQSVIDSFNAVYPGGDYEALKNRFAGLNEQGCPLN